MGAESPNVILYDVNGQEMSVSNGAAIPANTSALMIAGSDGTNSRFITLDTSGHPMIVGAGAAGSALVGNPVQIGGSDGTNTRTIATDGYGHILIAPSNFLGRLPVSLTEVEDEFSQVVVAQRLPQIQIPFYAETPATLLTITTSGGATTSQGTGVGTFSTGTAVTAEVKGVSFSTVFYSPHSEIYAALTASFTTPTSAATYQRIGLYNSTDGFSFGYNGTTFGLWLRYNSVDTFIAQTSWNIDTVSGSAGSTFTQNSSPVALVTTDINLYRIRFGWLGIAPVVFEILSPDGNFVTVHKAYFPNSQTTASVTNPNMPLTVDINKTSADATNLSITSGCWVAGVSSSTTPTFSGINTISSNGAFVLIPTIGLAGLSFNITGTWSGTLLFQFTMDGVNWLNDTALNNSVGGFTGGTTTNQSFSTSVGGYKQYRIISSAWSSGTAIVSYSTGPYPSIIATKTFITDASNDGPVAVKPAFTAATTADPALVVAVSPNNPVIIAGSDHITTNKAFVDTNGILSVEDTRDRRLLEQVIYNQSNYGDLLLDVLSYIKNSLNTSVHTINTMETLYGLNNQPITCTLFFLNISPVGPSQRQSTVINNSTTLFRDALVQVQIKTGPSGVSATGIVNVYVYGSSDGGTTYGDGVTGVDGYVTLTSPPNLKLITTMNTVANATVYKSNPASVAAAFGYNMPQFWGIVVENKSGAIFDGTASNFKTVYQGISYQSV